MRGWGVVFYYIVYGDGFEIWEFSLGQNEFEILVDSQEEVFFKKIE